MKIGDSVVVVNAQESNGSTAHPAIINRIWGDNMINVTMFPDCGTAQCVTSIPRQGSDFDNGGVAFVELKDYPDYVAPEVQQAPRVEAIQEE